MFASDDTSTRQDSGRVTGTWLTMPQPKLGQAGLMALLVLTSLAMPLSLDMYTPAVPHMVEHLNTNEFMVNLTLVGYYLFLAIGLLVFGPLADRRGRKPVLLGGLAAYVAGSLLCAIAPSIEMLICARLVQALDAGAADSMTNAIIKDTVVEEKRQLAISFVQLMFIIGPVAAPIVGALIVSALSWRATFWVLVAVGLLCLGMTALYRETLPPERRVHGKDAGTIVQFKAVFSNRAFAAFLPVSAMFNVPFMGYVAVASYIYESVFGLSEMGYSTFFSIVALITAVGPFAWTFASRFVSARRFYSAFSLFALASGIAMLAAGHASPVAFCLCFLVFAVAEASIRPLAVNVLLPQFDGDSGSASSAINFVHTVVGCLGMLAVHAPVGDYVDALAWTIVVSMLVSIAGWAWVQRSGIEVRGL
jgi:DHA1 family bicyclomycin/chloramphenicol resistance-like MFS transporter